MYFQSRGPSLIPSIFVLLSTTQRISIAFSVPFQKSYGFHTLLLLDFMPPKNYTSANAAFICISDIRRVRKNIPEIVMTGKHRHEFG